MTREEAYTFVGIMKSLQGLFDGTEALDDIRLKVEHAYNHGSAKPTLTLDLSHFSLEQEIKGYLGIISDSIATNRLLVFDYINRDMEYIERTVEPNWIDFRHGHWYIIGFCRVRRDYRRFKLVRIKRLEQGPSFVKKELSEVRIAEIIEQSYERRDMKVVLRFTPRIGAQLTEYFQQDKISRDAEGFFVVSDHFPYEEGLLKFILSFGKECELLEPRELRTELRRYVQNMLLSYND